MNALAKIAAPDPADGGNAGELSQALNAAASVVPEGSPFASLLASFAPLIMKMTTDAEQARVEAQAFHGEMREAITRLETAIKELTDALSGA